MGMRYLATEVFPLHICLSVLLCSTHTKLPSCLQRSHIQLKLPLPNDV